MFSSVKRTTLILFFTLAVVMMSYGLMLPVLPTYVQSMGGGGRDMGFMMAIYALMQLLMSPLWGNLSDTIGRKPVILIGVAGTAATLLFYGLLTELWMFYVARVFSGAFASATLPAAMATIGDTTTEEERGGGMGWISAAMYSGMMLGPGVSGWLASVTIDLPFYVGSGLTFLVLLFVLLALEESLPPEQCEPLDWSCLRGPDFKEMWRALRGPLAFMMFLSFLFAFTLVCYWHMFGLYTDLRYGYGPGEVGTVMMFVGACSAVVQIFLTEPLSKRWGEANLIRVTLLGSAVGFGLMLMAQNFLAVLLTSGFFVVSNSLLRPLVTSLVSKQASSHEQGAALGINNSFMSLGQIFGSLWTGFAIDYYIHLPYISGALAMVIGLLVMLIGGASRRRPATRYRGTIE